MKKRIILYASLFLLGFSFHSYGQNQKQINKKTSSNRIFNGVYQTLEGGKEFFQYDNKELKINIDTIPVVHLSDFEEISVDNERHELTIKLSVSGTEKLRKATKKNIGKSLGIIVNNELLSMPTVRQEVNSGIVLILFSGKSKMQETKNYLTKFIKTK